MSFDSPPTGIDAELVQAPLGETRRSPPASVHTAGRTDTLVGIQLLRGLAALLVVFHHYVGTSTERGFVIAGLAGSQVGNVGVDIFFIISGFIMEYTSGGKPYVPGDRARFIARRLIRILPLYWTLTILAFAIATLSGNAVHSPAPVHQFITSMLVLPGDDGTGKTGYIISMAWTLTYEFYFYLLFSVLLSATARTRFMILALTFGLCAVAERVFAPTHPLLGILTNPLLFEFLAGCLLAQLFRAGKTISQFASILLIGLAAVVLLLELKLQVQDSWARLAAWGIPAAMLVYGTVLCSTSLRPGRRPLPIQALEHVGDISYSLYLSHFFSIALFVRLYAMLSKKFAIAPELAGIALFATTLLIAQACYQWIENPSRKALQARFLRKKKLAPR